MKTAALLLLVVLAAALMCARGVRDHNGAHTAASTAQDEAATHVIRTHGKYRDLSKLSGDDFQENELVRKLLSESNIDKFLVPDSEYGEERRAWVTHLTSDGFIAGARTLGQSIVRTNTKYPLLLLHTDGVTEQGLDVLRKDGVWKLKRISAIQNPNSNHYMYQDRLKFIYTKCHIYNTTEYDKLVYLDADMILLENSDELFDCPGFCASIRHSFFNGGLIVVRPSRALFDDVVNKFSVLPSYNGGEQGLMNAYFWDFDIRCPMFHDDPDTRRRFKEHKYNCGRLPSYYNGDIGPYYLHDASWLLPEQRSTPKIVHFTLGPVKPWSWWWFPVLDICWVWYEMYITIPGVPSRPLQQIASPSLFYLMVAPLAVPFLIYSLVPGQFLRAVDCVLLRAARPLAQLDAVVHTFKEGASLPLVTGLLAFSVLLFFIPFQLAFGWIASPDFPVMHPGWGIFVCFEYVALLYFSALAAFHRFSMLVGVEASVRCALAGRLSPPGAFRHAADDPKAAATLLRSQAVYVAVFLALSVFLLIFTCQPAWYTLSSKITTAVAVGAVLVYIALVLGAHYTLLWFQLGAVTGKQEKR